ncbi:hypothetical protein EJ04DRAFT_594421, partial [Polyplosphaeria fusca]
GDPTILFSIFSNISRLKPQRPRQDLSLSFSYINAQILTIFHQYLIMGPPFSKQPSNAVSSLPPSPSSDITMIIQQSKSLLNDLSDLTKSHEETPSANGLQGTSNGSSKSASPPPSPANTTKSRPTSSTALLEPNVLIMPEHHTNAVEESSSTTSRTQSSTLDATKQLHPSHKRRTSTYRPSLQHAANKSVWRDIGDGIQVWDHLSRSQTPDNGKGKQLETCPVVPSAPATGVQKHTRLPPISALVSSINLQAISDQRVAAASLANLHLPQSSNQDPRDYNRTLEALQGLYASMQRLTPQSASVGSSASSMKKSAPAPRAPQAESRPTGASIRKAKIVKGSSSAYWKRSSKLREVSFRPRLQRYLEQQLCDAERDIINILARFGTLNRLNTVDNFSVDQESRASDPVYGTTSKRYTPRTRMQGAYYWALARDRRTEPEIGADLMLAPPVLLDWVCDLADNVDWVCDLADNVDWVCDLADNVD